MPVVSIPVIELKNKLKCKMSNENLITALQEIGCDVEELTNINNIKCTNCDNIIEFTTTETLPKACDICNVKFKDKNSYLIMPELEVLRLDLLANRPDNFDFNGLARSLNGYLGHDTGFIDYRTEPSEYTVIVNENVKNIRPHITCAIIENINLSENYLKNLMKLQENIHWALGRNRKLASIGVYNLDKISKIIHYNAVEPEEIKFIPLGFSLNDENNCITLRKILEEHPKGKVFADLLISYERYPLLIDDNDVVLSMPPIINSEGTKVTKNTKNLFLDVTGFDRDIINSALHIILASIKDENKDAVIKTVEIRYEENHYSTPILKSEEFKVSISNIHKILGIDISSENLITCLEKMRYKAVKRNDDYILVSIPCYRSDIKHEYDIIEDIAIGYGYKNIAGKPIETFTIGEADSFEEYINAVRELIAGMGFLEIFNLMLTNEEMAYTKLNHSVPGNRVIIENPISFEQTILRTELISGLLFTLSKNIDVELPHEIFEIGNVVTTNIERFDKTDEQKMIACAICDYRVGFSDIKSVVKTLLHYIDIDFSLESLDDKFYIPKRAATIYFENEKVGHMGEVHPEVIINFGINNPVVVMELNLSKAYKRKMKIGD